VSPVALDVLPGRGRRGARNRARPVRGGRPPGASPAVPGAASLDLALATAFALRRRPTRVV